MQIGKNGYFDGGMQSNNPVLEVIDEVKTLHGEEAAVQAIVSIGTGESKGLAPSGGLLKFMNSILARITGAESKHREFIKQHKARSKSYCRLQETGTLSSIDLAALDQLSEIERLAETYSESENGKN
jgi:hypothetical protein